MEIVNLYLFTDEFFTEKNAAKDFVSDLYADMRKLDSDKLVIYMLSRSSMIDNLCKQTKDNLSLTLLRVTQANLLYYASHGVNDKTLCQTALDKIGEVDEEYRDDWGSGLKYGYYSVFGNLCLHKYELDLEDENHNYTLKDLQVLMRAKYFYTTLFEFYLKQEIDVRGNNTKKLISNYSQVLGTLSRYVEPFYYLEQVEKMNRGFNGETKLSKVILYESIMKKTCDHYTPVILLRMDRDIRSIKKDKNFNQYRLEALNEIQDDIKVDFDKYKKEHGMGRNEVSAISRELDKGRSKLDDYTKFTTKYRLGLNQHGLYCQCEKGIIDDLSIRSAHKHTQIDWTNRFELLITAIRNDFESSRSKYFESVLKNSNTKNIQVLQDTKFTDDGIYLNKKSISLTESFNKCLSILDTIANVFNSAHEIMPNDERSKIEFVNYFDRKIVKKYIEDYESNLFAGALYSISYEFRSSNKFSMFKEMKSWRNALEHDSLILAEDTKDLSELSRLFPDVRTFMHKTEFENKTLFLLQLTRSAIFSLVWDLRKLTKERN